MGTGTRTWDTKGLARSLAEYVRQCGTMTEVAATKVAVDVGPKKNYSPFSMVRDAFVELLEDYVEKDAQLERWKDEFAKMVRIRDRFVEELREAIVERDSWRACAGAIEICKECGGSRSDTRGAWHEPGCRWVTLEQVAQAVDVERRDCADEIHANACASDCITLDAENKTRGLCIVCHVVRDCQTMIRARCEKPAASKCLRCGGAGKAPCSLKCQHWDCDEPGQPNPCMSCKGTGKISETQHQDGSPSDEPAFRPDDRREPGASRSPAASGVPEDATRKGLEFLTSERVECLWTAGQFDRGVTKEQARVLTATDARALLLMARSYLAMVDVECSCPRCHACDAKATQKVKTENKAEGESEWTFCCDAHAVVVGSLRDTWTGVYPCDVCKAS